jgi:hypothetical protein
VQPLSLQPPAADVGVRNFAQLNSTFAQLTGIPTNNPAVVSTYQSVQQQLPPINTLEAYSSANHVGVAQLAVQYCDEVIGSSSAMAKVFPGVTLNASTFPSQQSTVVADLAALAVGSGNLMSQPAPSTVSTELNNLIGRLCGSTPCTTTARAQAVAVAACAAAIGNADVVIY